MNKEVIEWNGKKVVSGDLVQVRYVESLGATRVGKKMDGKWFKIRKTRNDGRLEIINLNGLKRIIQPEHIVDIRKEYEVSQYHERFPYGTLK